ncbi:MAG: tetratricopeptide repeat protein [Fimbriimonadaceae bacterium]|nr:tetratricopeptide repeat protein [Fimbriimonadaceae bacterium]QYK55154.1 MAG: tetratricopeptide repeat protein [Fimbriimonadaceae bacterium]
MAADSNTYSFLFTDIEGSTRLWQERPDAMRVALARHDALLRACIEGHGGAVFKTVGDAFYSVFTDPRGALEAASAAQRGLIEVTIDEGGVASPLRVRMALHTGVVEERDGDYFGQPLNRVARLLATASGGQTLLSVATYELIRDRLPPGTTVKSLGEHRLKDLGRPETVFQACFPDLPSDFPPIRSLDNPELRHNLPLQVTSFIGRDSELAAVHSLLQAKRLVTLTGSGGTGKTRLALQAAADAIDRFEDGVWLVELAALADPGLVPQATAQALDLAEEAGRPVLRTLVEFLGAKQLLLVLDNCEHLLDAAARLADAVLRECPGVKVLTTSREPLGISGETTFRVPSLSLPNPAQDRSPEALALFEAVRLFVDRAVSVHAGFQVTNDNAPAVASICHRLDGIPLAIELAAARVRSLTAEEISERLDSRFRLLTGGSRTALPRQQTLRSLIDWSYDLLSPQERLLLARLSVFAGGWTLEATERVVSGKEIEDWETLDLLTSLVDKSLVVPEPLGDAMRYRLLESVRQYAREKLDGGGEGAAVRSRHRDFFLALAEEAEPQLKGAGQAEWLNRLEQEHDNLRAALEWSTGEADPAQALRLCGALWRFWMARGHFTEGRNWCRQALALASGEGPDPARAEALNGAGVLDFMQGEFSAARASFEDSLAEYRALADRQGLASLLNNLGNVAKVLGDFPSARGSYEESLAIRRDIGDKYGTAASLDNLGNVVHNLGDYETAQAHYEESLAIRQEIGDRSGEANALNNLGIAASANGDNQAARAYLEACLQIRTELGDRVGVATALLNLGLVAHEQGDTDAARAFFERSLAIQKETGSRTIESDTHAQLGYLALSLGDTAAASRHQAEGLRVRRDLGDRLGIAGSLEAFAILSVIGGEAELAARLLGAAAALREALGAPPEPSEQRDIDENTARARGLIGDAEFERLVSEGRSQPLEQAVEHLLQMHA